MAGCPGRSWPRSSLCSRRERLACRMSTRLGRNQVQAGSNREFLRALASVGQLHGPSGSKLEQISWMDEEHMLYACHLEQPLPVPCSSDWLTVSSDLYTGKLPLKSNLWSKYPFQTCSLYAQSRPRACVFRFLKCSQHFALSLNAKAGTYCGASFQKDYILVSRMACTCRKCFGFELRIVMYGHQLGYSQLINKWYWKGRYLYQALSTWCRALDGEHQKG